MQDRLVWTLPNILTISRIALAPVIALLPFIEGYWPKLIAFVVFIAAAISDIYDGKLARERKQISDLGKELDPLADKLMLFAMLVPIYFVTRDPMRQYEIPWWGQLPLWVALLLIGREIIMTVFRRVAHRRGIVIPAGPAGKIKTLVQNIFIAATFLWFAWKDLRAAYGWQTGWFGQFWEKFHGAFVAVTLAVAVVLTLYSLGVYFYRYRALFRGSAAAPPRADGS